AVLLLIVPVLLGCLYSLVLAGHFYHIQLRPRWPGGVWYLVLGYAVFCAAAFICGVFLDMLDFRQFIWTIYTLWSLTPLAVMPKQWKWLIPAAVGGLISLIPQRFVMLSCSMFATVMDICGPDMSARPYLVYPWLVYIALPLAAAGWLCYVKGCANAADKTFRAMFGKGAAALAVIFVLTYCIALGMAFAAHRQTERYVTEMENFFGRPVNAEGLKELYYRDRKPDAAFWRKVLAAKLGSDPDFREPAAEYPAEKLAGYRKKLENSAKLRELEAMFETEPPAFDRNFQEGDLFGELLPDLSPLGEFRRYEAFRIRFAVADRDPERALRGWKRLANIRAYLSREPMLISALVLTAVEFTRLDMLEMMLFADLLTDDQLRGIRAELAACREQGKTIHRNAVYSEAVLSMDACLFLSRKLKFRDENKTVDLYPHRWLLPVGWYWFTLNRGVMAKHHIGSDFTRMRYPYRKSKSASYFLADMFMPALDRAGNKFHSLAARYLAMETLIGIELEKRRTGKYPDTLANPPLDPFGHPLLYKHGKVPFLPVPGNGASLMSSPRKPVMVEGVMVWSTGPDGEDSQGLSRWRPPAKKDLFDDVRALKLLPAGK
ncbi:MAG: hypothetical protein IKO93_21215, partial [Lentisphaeria bacterium]|nr:hypothetical protein [Lentisphaeria bacterium]